VNIDVNEFKRHDDVEDYRRESPLHKAFAVGVLNDHGNGIILDDAAVYDDNWRLRFE
jgi:hypothetical protein